MEFSKLHSEAKYNLATSGVMSCSLSDLHIRCEDLEINAPAHYGYRPLIEAIVRLRNVAPESVVLTEGTSMANHLALAALFAPGDEVLIEEPTYELLLSTALYLGASVRRFRRRFEDAYEIDPHEVARNITAKTRLIVLGNLHNPSSQLTGVNTLRAIGDLAREAGARVLVDEVYLEVLHHPRAPTSLHLGDHFVATSSLTKGYGLSGLRCGWILAEPELAHRIRRLDDLYSASPVHIAQLLSVRGIEQIDALAARAGALIEVNRRALTEIVGNHAAIEMPMPGAGTTVFPRLRKGDPEAFFDRLRSRYETSVVPGRYFEEPRNFRVGLAADPAMTREGLVRLAQALNEWQRSPAGAGP